MWQRMWDRTQYPRAPLVVPDGGDRDGVHWDGWRVVFPTDAEYNEEYTAALHQHMVYGPPMRYATETEIAAEMARRAAPATAWHGLETADDDQ
jgi:hypothetical protein